MILERLQELARRYVAVRPWMLALAALSLGVATWILLTSGDQADDIAFIPAMLFFAWATMLHSFLNLFSHIPSRVQRGGKFGKQLTARLKRGAYYMFAILMAMVSLLLLVTTLQMLSAWRTMY